MANSGFGPDQFSKFDQFVRNVLALPPKAKVQVQQNARLDFDLSLGQVSETVGVSASAQLLSTENASPRTSGSNGGDFHSSSGSGGCTS